MSVPQPTPDQARAAILEATKAQAPVRGQDRLYAARLYGLAISIVALSIVIVFLTALPPWAGPLQAVLAGLALTGAILIVVAAQRRQHAFSRGGNRLFIGTLLVTIVWAEIVWQVTIRSGWIAPTLAHAERQANFVLMAVVAVLPLLVAAFVFRFRR